MTLTPSNMLALGTTAPDFTLLDTVTGQLKHLDDLKSDTATVIMFICNHCPFVKHIEHELPKLANEYIPKNVAFIAISSNDVEHFPSDGPKEMAKNAKALGYPFPYLYDETQAVAKSYEAACTPDLYVFDGTMKLVYRGQLDDSRPGNNVPVTGKDLRTALDLLLAGQPLPKETQKPSMGCNIKWKS